MRSKKEKFLGKIVKKDYNNQLEEVLEKKLFDENAKNLLLSILYKIEAGYDDYVTVKRDIETKDEYIQNFIDNIKNNCDNVKIVKLNSEENEILGNKTFLVEKENKRIICYPIERKLLYCISKISKNDKIINEKYEIIDKTLSDLINIGNNIETVEPLRDFNGYSWTTITKEIESIEHNIIYQNLRILLGHKFMSNWINNNEFIIDYFELLKNKISEKYGERNGKILLKELLKISVLINIKVNKKDRETYEKLKEEIGKELERIKNKEDFVKMITEEKKKLTEEIKRIDETLNNKELLQEEYIKRNENLPLEKKIFSARILSKMMIEEREKDFEEIEKLNELMNPKKFVKYKREKEEKYKYLKLIDIKDINKEIKKQIINFQKVFLKCYNSKIEEIVNRQELMDLIYEFRYYNLIPVEQDKKIYEIEEIKEELENTGKQLIKKAIELKIINKISKNVELNYEILKYIFQIKIINIDNLNIKIIKEKEKFFIQFFDENVSEEKIEVSKMGNINKKDLTIKINRKTEIFN